MISLIYVHSKDETFAELRVTRGSVSWWITEHMCTSRSSMSDSVNWVTMSSCSHYVCGHIESKDNSVKPPSWTRRSYEGIKALGSTVYNKQYHERESKGIRGVDWRFSCVWWNFQRLYEDKVFVVLEWDSVCKLIVPSHNNDIVLTKWIAKMWEWDSIKAAINNIFVLTIDKITFCHCFGFTACSFTVLVSLSSLSSTSLMAAAGRCLFLYKAPVRYLSRQRSI